MSARADGGPAFPTPGDDRFPRDSYNGQTKPGMTLRDYFATNAPADEVRELTFRHLSRLAQERLTGLPYPSNPQAGGNEQVEFQLSEFNFKCLVNAEIRYSLADAMLQVRGQR